MKLDHLGVVVSDCARSERFYTNALGCTAFSRWKNDEVKAVILQCDGLMIELLQYVNPSPQYETAGVVNHLAFKVDDLAAQMERVKNLGATFETAAPRSISNHKKIIFFRGPDGERIELVEEK